MDIYNVYIIYIIYKHLLFFPCASATTEYEISGYMCIVFFLWFHHFTIWRECHKTGSKTLFLLVHMLNIHRFFTPFFSLHGSMPVHRKHAATEYRSNTCFETHRAFDWMANFFDLRTKSSSTYFSIYLGFSLWKS